MGVVHKSVWRQYRGALRDKLKHCQTDICTCIEELIEEFMTGHAGLPERFDRMMGPNANQAGIPGHAEQIEGKQRGLAQSLDAFDEHGCGPGGGAVALADEYVDRPIPTQADWEAEHGRPMPLGDTGPSPLGRVGYGLAAVGLGVLAVGAALIPFDGPVGEAVLGSAAIGMGAAAVQ